MIALNSPKSNSLRPIHRTWANRGDFLTILWVQVQVEVHQVFDLHVFEVFHRRVLALQVLLHPVAAREPCVAATLRHAAVVTERGAQRGLMVLVSHQALVLVQLIHGARHPRLDALAVVLLLLLLLLLVHGAAQRVGQPDTAVWSSVPQLDEGLTHDAVLLRRQGVGQEGLGNTWWVGRT